ncbi:MULTISPECIES: hypothetical protein [Achromobacter]|uniref:Uncharacterized protein n=1 Tax=Achromobacter aegrifaciens TaxID=1287736 RepID=A0AAD2KLY2_ACHAE|nr:MULTISPECIES: hypothetical protein [Achromobacter]CAB3921068.1 hypothetical protein LMG26684_05709 [Achromobacter mucicolens]CUJ72257.1 Uncharacterised protein [Achromobacter aegrifaciens]
MKKLKLTICIDHDIPDEGKVRSVVSADLVQQLRVLADHIERAGLTGQHPHLAGQVDDSNFPRMRYLLLEDQGVQCTEIVSGPTCAPPPVADAHVTRVAAILDSLMLALDCVFPEDLYAAANIHAAVTGDRSSLEVAEDFASTRNRDRMALLRQYEAAYSHGLGTEKAVIARALAAQNMCRA